MGDGHWPSRNPAADGWERWEPTGCRMHSYTREDFMKCLNGRRMVFVGDSSTRQLYWAAGRRLDHVKTEIALLEEYNSQNSKQANIAMELEGVKIEFIWDPWLNSSDYHKTLTGFRDTPDFSDVESMKEVRDSPALLIVGAPGHWAARHSSSTYLDIFKAGIDTLSPHVKEKLAIPPPGSNGPTISDIPNRIMIVPVQTPHYDELLPDRQRTMTPNKITAMNSYLRQSSVIDQSHVLWSFEQMSDGIYEAYEETGLHVVDGVADRRLDVVLNAQCNAVLAVMDRQFKYTCCMSYLAPGWGQLLYLLSAIVFIITVFLRSRYDPDFGTGNAGAIAALTLVSIYAYIVDRTHAMPKTSVDYNVTPFLVKSAAFVLVSLSSFKKLKGAVPGSKLPQPADREFIPREISDETKGIIQAFLLIGHYHGLEKVDWAYKLARFLVAGYVFLSTYGHAIYFLSTGDFSFRRVVKVLVRVNVLGLVLSFALSGTWSMYEFLPAISFWFLVTYITLAVGSKWNEDGAIVILKALVSLLFVNILMKTPLFDPIIRVLGFALRGSWSTGPITKQLLGDRYIPFLALVTANIVHRVNLQKMQATRHQSWLGGRETYRRTMPGPAAALVDGLVSIIRNQNVSPLLKPIVFIVAGAGLIVYLILMHTAIHTRDRYDQLHPLISLGPVLAYILVRNAFELFRRCYLRVPRSLGRICVATYVLHHHIWMAGNGSNILRVGLIEGGLLGSMSRLVEEILITILFLWVASNAAKAIPVFVAWLVGEEVAPESRDPGTLLDPALSVSVPKPILTDHEAAIRIGAFASFVWVGSLVF